MNRFSAMFLSTVICLTGSSTLAADLPAESVCLNLNDYADMHYIIKRGTICVLENVNNKFGVSDKDVKPYKTGEYFNDVRSLAGGYTGSVYMSDGSKSGSFFIKNDGSLWEYKINENGSESTPIDKIHDCIEVCSGAEHVAVLTSDGTVYAWGDNSYGQLGDNESDYAYEPKKVLGLSDIVDIAAGDYFTLAVDSEGKAYIWGYSKFNELSDNNSPVRIEGIDDCVEIARGFSYVLARRYDGKVYQWLEKDWGVYENPFNKEYYNMPVLIPDLNDCKQVTAQPYGYKTGLMLSSEYVWYHWKTVFDYHPQKIQRVVYEPVKNVKEAVSGRNYYLIFNDNSLYMMNFNEYDLFSGLTCIEDNDSDDKIKTERIRFIKRGEFASKIVELYESLGGTIPEEHTNKFNDTKDSRYKSDIEKCYLMGVMNGVDECGNFSYNKVLRREQAAVTIYRLIELLDQTDNLKKTTILFDDDSLISSWAKESVYKTAMLFETADNTYSPQEYVTEAELNKLIHNVRFLCIN